MVEAKVTRRPLARQYAILYALDYGETVQVEGLWWSKDKGALAPGDQYVAERDGPAVVLTCKNINYPMHWVVPVEDAYFYDTWECVKVKSASPKM